ncbi:MAG: STN domain-containing protein [Ancalomicrobiaceae bacterium]|nr:STN domain-containing protein [Ancalomicrobiaceae bacterium]
MWLTRSSGLVVSALIAGCGGCQVAVAEPPQPQPQQSVNFDIPAQSLESALERYAGASHLQVLYESATASGLRSTAVRGIYTYEAALRLLLNGTGLDYNYTEERAFTLVPADPRPEVVLQRRIAAFGPFLGNVQAGVMAALCHRPETRPGSFAVAMQFRVGPSGKLEAPSLLSSTGSIVRDAAIAETLAQVALAEVPPEGLPQPITMRLRASPPGGRDECAATRY